MAKQSIIKLSELILDKRIYSRNGLDNETVKQYRDAILSGASFPPIIVGIYKDKKMIVDGYHRVTVFRKLKKNHIDCIVKNFKTERDLFIESVRCNNSHGKPFEKYEKKRIIEKLEKMNVSPIDISNIVCIPKVDICRILRFSSMKNHKGDVVGINEEIRNEVARERIDSFILIERFNSFYNDLVKFKESKREASEVERVKLLDIARLIRRICS